MNVCSLQCGTIGYLLSPVKTQADTKDPVWRKLSATATLQDPLDGASELLRRPGLVEEGIDPELLRFGGIHEVTEASTEDHRDVRPEAA